MTTTPTPQHGMTLEVVRGHDCTLGGVSSRFDRVTVVGVLDDRDLRLGSHTPAADRVEAMPEDLRIDPVTDDAPAVWLRVRKIGGLGIVFTVEPATAIGEPRPWFTYGGNRAASSDPRWISFVDAEPLKVLDRVEL